MGNAIRLAHLVIGATGCTSSLPYPHSRLGLYPRSEKSGVVVAQSSRLHRPVLNRRFEAWYNVDGPEQPTYAPYHFQFGPCKYAFRVLEDPLVFRYPPDENGPHLAVEGVKIEHD